MANIKKKKEKVLPSPAAISDRACAGDSTTSSFIPSTNVPYKPTQQGNTRKNSDKDKGYAKSEKNRHHDINYLHEGLKYEIPT